MSASDDEATPSNDKPARAADGTRRPDQGERPAAAPFGGAKRNEPPASLPTGLREQALPFRPQTAGDRLRVEDVLFAAQGQVVRLPFAQRAVEDEPRPWAPGRLVRVLVVEADTGDGEYIEGLLEYAPLLRFDVTHAGSPEAALRRLVQRSHDIALIGYDLPKQNGVELIKTLQERGFSLPMVLVAGEITPAIEAEALEADLPDLLEREELDTGKLERAIRFVLARTDRAERLARASGVDPLTGLPGRGLLEERLKRAVAAVGRRGGMAALLALELPDLMAVNTRMGRDAGDRLIKAIGKRLDCCLRETDTVARRRGDGFAALIEDLRKPEDAELVAAKLQTALAEPIRVGLEEMIPRVRLGLAIYPDDAPEALALLDAAEAALAKAEDTNVVTFPSIRRVGNAAHKGTKLRQAFENGLMQLRYLPQMTVNSPEIGLTLWPALANPSGPELDAPAVRQMAEDAGLHDALTWWQVEEGAKQLGRWHRDGMPGVRLSVPLVARRDLAWSALADHAATCMDREGVARHRMEFEIEEERLRHEFDLGGKGLSDLREAGLRLAWVSFGEGRCSMRLLRDAPLDTVKLSPRMLDGVPMDRHRSLFLEAVTYLVRMSQMRLVACGVEDPAQIHALKRLGCHALEGTIGLPALSAADCVGWLRQAMRRHLPPG